MSQELLLGDSSKARKVLGWKPSVNFLVRTLHPTHAHQALMFINFDEIKQKKLLCIALILLDWNEFYQDIYFQ